MKSHFPVLDENFIVRCHRCYQYLVLMICYGIVWYFLKNAYEKIDALYIKQIGG